MADTQRTITEIMALLADNNTGAISPQDVRDAVATLVPDSGNIYSLANTTPSVIAAVDTWYIANLGSPILAAGAVNFDNPGFAALRYIGNTTRRVKLLASLSLTSAANNKEFAFSFAKNGTAMPEMETRRKAATGADVGTLAITAIVTSVVNGDYFDLVVKNVTDATDVTIEFCNVVAIGFPA